ncbi:MAG: galactitol-1-phosphate 5-dehydrogenase [Chloroflexi bacterium]|nr:galactitol-1-phosphate 5-dehydrogenase [Chloroflexota bacterium]
MKALVYTAPRRMELQDLPRPEPGPGEVLIQVEAAGICGSDVHGFRGLSARRKPPLVMGHEFTGRVAALGPGVDDPPVGQRVVVNPLLPCGTCELCLSGRGHICPNRKLIGMDRPGAFAEYVTAPRQSVFPLPEGMSPVLGTMAEALANPVHIIRHNVSGLVQGVAIVGAGTQGLLALEMTRLVGISPRIITDVEPYRLEVAQRLGAEVVVNAREQNPVEAVRQATRGRGVDLVIEAVGHNATRGQAIAMAAPGGRIVFLGLHEVMSELDCQAIVAQELTVHGSYAYSPHDFLTALDLLASGRVEVSAWLEEAPLADGQQVFETLADRPGRLIKVALIP